MRHFLKIIPVTFPTHKLRQDRQNMFFFKLLLILPTRKLATKRGTFFISYTEYKIRKFLFIYHKSISSFVHLTSQKVLKIALVKCNLIWLTPPTSRATLLCKAAVFRYRNRPQKENIMDSGGLSL